MAGMLAISPPPTSLKAIRVRARAGSRSCAKRFKARSKSVSHFEGLSKPGKCLLKRLLSSQVAQGRFYGPDATPHDLGDNPIRSESNYTLESGQRTKLTETFYFDHDGDGGQTTPDVARTTTYDWAYDANDRLLSETIDHHDDALDRTESFVMDLFGNRTNRTIDYVDPTAVDQAFAYTYDDNDRLTTETLDESANGSIDQTTRYSWDSTQQTAKEVFTDSSTNPADIISSQSFSYDLQGRLAEVITTPETGSATKVTYSYDSSGIRISSSKFTDANTNDIFETSELDHTIEYLVDHRNHTGYAQTITETTTDGNGDNVSRTTYTFGSDELSQTTYTPDPATADAWLAEAMHFFGHDAHGSVRVLLDALGEIAQTFTYAAYGELLVIYDATGTLVGTLGAADTAAALTNLLYSGESFDSRIGQQYLRARWYDSVAGRFSRLDPYFGDIFEPLRFNKYLYSNGNPILGTDPSGLTTLVGSISVSAIGAQLNTIEGETGQKVAETALAIAAGASAGQALIFLVSFELAGAGIPFLGNAVGKLIGTFGKGLKHIERFLPMKGSNLLLPGILKLEGRNAARFIGELFDPSLTKNAGDSAALRRNLSELLGHGRTGLDDVAMQAHHVIPSQIAKNSDLLKNLNFNMDAALNALPLNKSVHGWSKPHAAYNQAIGEILKKIEKSGLPDGRQRELVMETMANASTAVLNGASLRNNLSNFTKADWLREINPLGLF